MALHPLGLVPKREGAGQMVEGILADPMDQVLGGVEGGRVRRGVQEGEVDVCQSCPSAGFADDRQQFTDGGLHRGPVDGGVVEDHGDPAIPHPGVAQHQQEDGYDRVFGFAFLAEIDMGRAPLQVDAEEAVHFFAAALVARHGRRGVLRRPGVVGVRDGLEGELIQRHEDAIRRKLGCFFLSRPRIRRVWPAWQARSPGARAGARGRIGGKAVACARPPIGFPTSARSGFVSAGLSTGSCPGHSRRASCAGGCNAGPCAVGATKPAGRPAARGRAGHRSRHGGKGRTNAPGSAGGPFARGTRRPWFARPRWPSRPAAASAGAGPCAGSRASATVPGLWGQSVGCGFFGS